MPTPAGEKTGQRRSLTQRIALLSLHGGTGSWSRFIDGGFVSHQNIEQFLYHNNGSPVRVSALSGGEPSIFV